MLGALGLGQRVATGDVGVGPRQMGLAVERVDAHRLVVHGQGAVAIADDLQQQPGQFVANDGVLRAEGQGAFVVVSGHLEPFAQCVGVGRGRIPARAKAGQVGRVVGVQRGDVLSL